MFDRFTDRARKVMSLSRQEAERLNHHFIGAEHILLGLMIDGSGVAANVLKNLNIDLNKAREALEKRIQPGSDPITLGQLPFTPRAKIVLELSIDEARSLDHNYIGSEHLLLGLIREDGGLGAQVLQEMGLSLEMVRREVMKFLGAGSELRGLRTNNPEGNPSKSPSLANLLMDALKSSEFPARGSAIEILGALKIKRAIPILIEHLGHHDPVIRAHADVALRAITGHSIPFDATGTPEQLNKAMNEWQEWLEKNKYRF